MSRRAERVARLIRTVVADAIQCRLNDPRIEPLTSVTRAEVTADLSLAHLHVSVMADEGRQRSCLRALQHAAGRLRLLVAEQTVLRQIPRLEFHLDESVRGSFETIERLDRIMTEMGEPPTWQETEGREVSPDAGPTIPGRDAETGKGQLRQEDA